MHRLLILAFCSLLFSAVGVAAPVTGLHEAEVPVAGLDAPAREAAVREALGQVVVKLTGRPGVLKEPAVQRLLGSAQTYMQQYRYLDETSENPRLWVSFEPRGVESALRQAGVALWGQQRPLTLVWLAVDAGRGHELVSGEGPPEASQAVKTAAAERGLPVLLPMLDTQDRQTLMPSDVWGRFQVPILAASRRYPSDAVLAGRVFALRSGKWESEWSLFQEGQAQRWSGRYGSEAEAIDAGIGGAVDALARRYVAPDLTAAPGLVTVSVRGVRRYQDYAEALHYLQSLPLVSSVQVLQATPSELRFALDVHGTQESLARALALEHRLVPVTGETVPGRSGLVYRWLR